MAAAGSRRWLWLALGIVAVDRATKSAVERLTPEGFRMGLVPHFVLLVHSFNPGIAFGLFSASGSRMVAVVLAAASAAVVGLLAWALWTGHAGTSAVSHAGVALIAGGAAGNLLDRILHGGVTDFLELRAGRFVWPAFNMADSAITIGALLLAYELLRGERPATRRHA